MGQAWKDTAFSLPRLAQIEGLLADGWPTSPVHFPFSFPALNELEQRVSELIASGLVGSAQARLLSNGEALDEDAYTRRGRGAPSYRGDRVDFHRVTEVIHHGGTLAVGGLGEAIPAVGRECARWSRLTGATVGSTLFVSGAGGSGFPLHYDTSHSVLFQVSGEKTWVCRPPVIQDPLDDHPWPAVEHLVDTDLNAGDDEAVTVTLRAGEMLWIPLGWRHEGTASQSHGSVHLTFGIRPVAARQIAQILVEDADGLISARTPVRAAAQKGTEPAAEVLRQTGTLLDELSTQLKSSYAVESRLHEVLLSGRTGPPEVSGKASEALTLARIDWSVVHAVADDERSGLSLHLGSRVVTLCPRSQVPGELLGDGLPLQGISSQLTAAIDVLFSAGCLVLVE